MISILLLENDPDHAELLKKKLREAFSDSCHIVHAKRVYEVSNYLKDQQFDIILTTYSLPEIGGVELIELLQKKAQDTPIILVGRAISEKEAAQAIRAGAQDHIPIDEINARMFARIIHYAIEREELGRGLRALSFTDELTQAYNRRGFITLLEQQISLAKRMKQGFILFFIDLDYLKSINDDYGHAMGDDALVEAAKATKKIFRRHDIVGRMGGDEFAVVAINAPRSTMETLKQNFLNRVQETDAKLNKPYTLSMSIGAAYFDPEESPSVGELFHRADYDLYLAKARIHHEQ